MSDLEHEPRSMCHFPAEARCELLVGLLSDQLYPARELIDALRLQSNASVTTRGNLLVDVGVTTRHNKVAMQRSLHAPLAAGR